MRRPAQVCQVPGCGADLSNLRSYFVRQHICEEHARADAVPDGHGGWLRFCQQCTKLEPVSAFEGLRRSCEASLQKRHLRRSGGAQRVKSATGSLAALAAQAPPPMAQQGGWGAGQLGLPHQLAHLGGIPPMPAPAPPPLPHAASAATIAAAIQAVAASAAAAPPPMPAPTAVPSGGGTWQQQPGGEDRKDRSSPCSTSSQQPAGTNRSTSEARGQGVKQEDAEAGPLAVLMAAAALPEAAADADGPVAIADAPPLASFTMDSSGNPVPRQPGMAASAQLPSTAPLGLGWPQQVVGWQQPPSSFGGAGSAADTRLPYQLSGASSKATVDQQGAPPAVDVQQMLTALQLLQQLQDVIGALLVAQVQQQQQQPLAPAPVAAPPAAGVQHLLQQLLGGAGLPRQEVQEAPPPPQQQGGEPQAILQLLQQLSAQQQQVPLQQLAAAGPPADAAPQDAAQGEEQHMHALLRRWVGALQQSTE